MSHQTLLVPQNPFHSPLISTQPITEFPQLDSGLVVPLFNPGDDPIACLNKAMAFMPLFKMAESLYNKFKEGKTHGRQCTQPKRPRNATWFKEKAMLAEAQESSQILEEEQLAFLADPGITDCHDVQPTIIHNAAFQTDDLDAYNSDYDDISSANAVLMANILNYGLDILSEVPNFDIYQNDMDNESVQAMQHFEQTLVVDSLDNEIASDSNITPYS
ncbi:hypothetical protein Tco_0451840 [Tanacetum coccineum]